MKNVHIHPYMCMQTTYKASPWGWCVHVNTFIPTQTPAWKYNNPQSPSGTVSDLQPLKRESRFMTPKGCQSDHVVKSATLNITSSDVHWWYFCNVMTKTKQNHTAKKCLYNLFHLSSCPPVHMNITVMFGPSFLSWSQVNISSKELYS